MRTFLIVLLCCLFTTLGQADEAPTPSPPATAAAPAAQAQPTAAPADKVAADKNAADKAGEKVAGDAAKQAPAQVQVTPSQAQTQTPPPEPAAAAPAAPQEPPKSPPATPAPEQTAPSAPITAPPAPTNAPAPAATPPSPMPGPAAPISTEPTANHQDAAANHDPAPAKDETGKPTAANAKPNSTAALKSPGSKANGQKTTKPATRPQPPLKAFGRGNNVPALLANYVVDHEKIAPATWIERHWSKALRWQVSALPPLRAGIRSEALQPPQEESEPLIKFESILTKQWGAPETGSHKTVDTLGMLSSLIEEQKNLKQRMQNLGKKLKASASEMEKQGVQEELSKLDKRLSETNSEFERWATGVKPDVFTDRQGEAFSWKDELASLLEPSIKELKQLTARARQKSDLKDAIDNYESQRATAHRAVTHLTKLIDSSQDPKIKAYLQELLPAWENVEKGLSNKLDMANHELAGLEKKNVSLLESSGSSIRDFFHDRGLYLLIALLTFVVIFLVCRLFLRLLFYILPGARREQRPVHVRIIDVFFQFFSVFASICGLILVLYITEDWFLLSLAIVLLVGIVWTLRQTLPKMWQQVRLMLNMGAMREGERVIYNGIPWKVEAINVFCKLHNPALGMTLRIPIETMVNAISRPFHHDEPWFPCKRGDWVAIGSKPLAKVTSLTHEHVEVVELGGRSTVYKTADFLSASPANLSRNFSMRVVFGLSYELQGQITTTVLATLETFLKKKLEEHGYGDDCLSLKVDFLQAGASSLDVAVLADFKGEQAQAYRRIERALNRWCVDCCNENSWDIPFPQLTVHLPTGTQPS